MNTIKFILSATFVVNLVKSLPPPNEVNLVPNLLDETLLVTFFPVANASYYIIEIPKISVTIETTEPAIIIPGIKIRTTYDVKITTVDQDGIKGDHQIYKITTESNSNETIEVLDVGTNSVTLHWTASAETEFYVVSYKVYPDGNQTTVTTTENELTIFGLTPLTDYLFKVAANDLTNSTELSTTARTDGLEIIFEYNWFVQYGVIEVIQGYVQRPRTFDMDNRINVTFACPVYKFETWNGKVFEISNNNKTISIIQDKEWMKPMTKIGFRFYYLQPACRLDVRLTSVSITETMEVENDNEASGMDQDNETIGDEQDIEIAVPIKIHTWGHGGMVQMNFEEVWENNPYIEDKSMVAYRMDGSDNCTSISVNYCWSIQMVLQNNTSDENMQLPFYFIQEKSSWHDKNPGIVLTIDKDGCVEPHDLSITALVGGISARSHYEKYNLQTHNELKCT